MAIDDVCVDEERTRAETYLRYLKICFSINFIDLIKSLKAIDENQNYEINFKNKKIIFIIVI